MNVQRLKTALEATGCPIRIVRVENGRASYETGPGATPEQVAAAAEVFRVYDSGGDSVYEIEQVREKAAEALDAKIGRALDPTEMALRAFFLMIVEDRYNTVLQFNALRQAVLDATSLGDLRARVTANVQALPPYGANLSNSINAIKNALKQRIGLGQVDP